VHVRSCAVCSAIHLYGQDTTIEPNQCARRRPGGISPAHDNYAREPRPPESGYLSRLRSHSARFCQSTGALKQPKKARRAISHIAALSRADARAGWPVSVAQASGAATARRQALCVSVLLLCRQGPLTVGGGRCPPACACRPSRCLVWTLVCALLQDRRSFCKKCPVQHVQRGQQGQFKNIGPSRRPEPAFGAQQQRLIDAYQKRSLPARPVDRRERSPNGSRVRAERKIWNRTRHEINGTTSRTISATLCAVGEMSPVKL